MTLTSGISFFNNRIRSTSPKLFEVAFPYLLYEYILVLQYVTYYFRATLTLTSDSSSGYVKPGAYII